jgi:uroporphyrinogen-III decarboxylase
MNNRERMLAVIDGRSPDRIPWVPRLEIWYTAHKNKGTLPEEYQGQSLRAIEKALGVGTPARAGRVFRTELNNVEVRIQEAQGEIRKEYVTPYGTVSTLHRSTDQLAKAGIVGLEVEHMIKDPDDYPVVEYIIEQTDIIPTFEEYLAYEQAIGEDGVPLIALGQDPMSHILQELIGYEQAYFHLHDHKKLVLHLFEVLKYQAGRIQQVVLDSPARLIMQGEHFDSMMTPPYIFSEYMLPYFQSFSESLRGCGKVLVGHADADTSLLLELIKEAGFGLLECFVTAPMVPVTLERAREVFGTNVVIWGGIPSVMLCDPFTGAEFQDYMHALFRTIAPGDAYILGVADNVMPEAKIERIKLVGKMVEQYGAYPVQA